ncbi:hypothetical protein IWW50_000526 [Coemansia erecta]|nr:hypothetical protein IWW50_000526 [Coemansia erecta]
MSDQSIHNSHDILCPRASCKCVIIRTNIAELVERTAVVLPQIGDTFEAASSAEPEELKRIEGTNKARFWKIHNMMDFENVGVSKSKDGVKYLSCAECDLAPIGCQTNDEHAGEFLVAVDRVRYISK